MMDLSAFDTKQHFRFEKDVVSIWKRCSFNKMIIFQSIIFVKLFFVKTAKHLFHKYSMKLMMQSVIYWGYWVICFWATEMWFCWLETETHGISQQGRPAGNSTGASSVSSTPGHGHPSGSCYCILLSAGQPKQKTLPKANPWKGGWGDQREKFLIKVWMAWTLCCLMSLKWLVQ